MCEGALSHPYLPVLPVGWVGGVGARCNAMIFIFLYSYTITACNEAHKKLFQTRKGFAISVDQTCNVQDGETTPWPFGQRGAPLHRGVMGGFPLWKVAVLLREVLGEVFEGALPHPNSMSCTSFAPSIKNTVKVRHASLTPCLRKYITVVFRFT